MTFAHESASRMPTQRTSIALYVSPTALRSSATVCSTLTCQPPNATSSFVDFDSTVVHVASQHCTFGDGIVHRIDGVLYGVCYDLGTMQANQLSPDYIFKLSV